MGPQAPSLSSLLTQNLEEALSTASLQLWPQKHLPSTPWQGQNRVSCHCAFLFLTPRERQAPGPEPGGGGRRCPSIHMACGGAQGSRTPWSLYSEFLHPEHISPVLLLWSPHLSPGVAA